MSSTIISEGTCGGSGTTQALVTGHRKGHRRQESFYEMTGLYSEMRGATDDSSADIPNDESDTTPPGTQLHTANSVPPDTVIKCHSRQPSSGLVVEKQLPPDDDDEEELSRDCGILSFRPYRMQKLARIKVKFMIE